MCYTESRSDLGSLILYQSWRLYWLNFHNFFWICLCKFLGGSRPICNISFVWWKKLQHCITAITFSPLFFLQRGIEIKLYFQANNNCDYLQKLHLFSSNVSEKWKLYEMLTLQKSDLEEVVCNSSYMFISIFLFGLYKLACFAPLFCQKFDTHWNSKQTTCNWIVWITSQFTSILS